MASSSQFGAYVPTTNIWDPSIIYASNLPPELKEILVRMYQNLNLMSNVINVKETAQYTNEFEMITSQQWFPNPNLNSLSSTTPTQRPVYRKVINFGALPNTGTTSVSHGIICTSATTFTRIYATASDTAGLNYIPIPYASASGTTNIEISVNSTNVNITTASNRSNFNVCYVILEYIQN